MSYRCPSDVFFLSWPLGSPIDLSDLADFFILKLATNNCHAALINDVLNTRCSVSVTISLSHKDLVRLASSTCMTK